MVCFVVCLFMPDASEAIRHLLCVLIVCSCLMPPRLHGIYCLFFSDALEAIWFVLFCFLPNAYEAIWIIVCFYVMH